MHIAPHNPWFAMHYATTRLNVLGQQINPGQQISPQQALYAYTRLCLVLEPHTKILGPGFLGLLRVRIGTVARVEALGGALALAGILWPAPPRVSRASLSRM